MPLSAINTGTPEGEKLLASAKEILKNLGKGTAESLSLSDLADTQKIFAATVFNGDGIIVPESSAKEETRKLIRDIMECVGHDMDRSGNPGISETRVTAFFTAVRAFSEWWKKTEQKDSPILFLKSETTRAVEVFKAVRDKIEDVFTRGRLARFDPRYCETGQLLEKEYAGLLKKNLSPDSPELREFPLVIGHPEQPLPLTGCFNPAWAMEMEQFREVVVTPILGKRTELSEADWQALKDKISPYLRWEQEKAGNQVEKLGLGYVRNILKSDAEKELADLISRDKALEPQFNAISSVEKLVRYYRNLFPLLNNFVSFRDFYSGKTKAIFQVGTLFIDGRSCELCLKVDDAAKHSAMASLCNTYLAYCDCVRHETSEKMCIAAAFTAGDADQIMVGRNGIFLDRQGRYWDASVIKIVEHPISIQQAFWSPYKRLGRMVHEQIEKFAASKDKAVTDNFSAGVADTGKKLEAGPAAAPPPQPFDVGKFAGIFAAIGLALGAIGTAIASIISGFLSLSWWQFPLALGGIVLAVSGPSMLLAAVRLRQRNLGPMLDANGWAVNTRAQINLLFGGTLTHLAELPPGSVRSFEDPFAEKKQPWKLYLFLVVFVAIVGYLMAQPGIRNHIKTAFIQWRADVQKKADELASSSRALQMNASATLPVAAPSALPASASSAAPASK